MQPADDSNLLRSEAELKLAHARKDKAERIKDLGSPIEITGKALALQVRENVAWIAENTTVIRKLDLETGKTLQLFKGHTAPVTSLAFVDRVPGSGKGDLLITGSWDKTIKVWDVQTKQLVSSTEAHSDFVKALHVIPSLGLLVSSGSDKIVRLWDLSNVRDGKPLTSVGVLTDHTRPVESLDVRPVSDTSAVLYTADTMGIIKIWDISKDNGTPPRWRSTLVGELQHHRTKVDDMIYGNGLLWTASTDETVHIIPHVAPAPAPAPGTKPIPPIQHPTAVRTILPLSVTPLGEPYLLTGSGDVIRVYDVSSPEEPELIAEIDAHWHDVTALRLWIRKSQVEGEPGKVRVEPWIVSASLDGTLRRWRLDDLLHPPPPKKVVEEEAKPASPPASTTEALDEDEERELAELMGED
ncbi:WD40 repeat-like protein [Polyporus arcularius HHB13444]|uniref:WD40 repeat-like protein n=1 Tax=Polyporus arcularius HHB13444 TaxID=1314778 RepID=A0A5C3P9N7_9APHY|nr:WD40 repeat-like protein [Polyporus arcularius HHB13444]